MAYDRYEANNAGHSTRGGRTQLVDGVLESWRGCRQRSTQLGAAIVPGRMHCGTTMRGPMGVHPLLSISKFLITNGKSHGLELMFATCMRC
jgi:hypothetical protein